jgi:hypothetical protein
MSAARMWSALIGQAGGGEGAVSGNYMPTEPGQDPSHLQFTDSEGSWPAPCRTYLFRIVTVEAAYRR